MKNTWITNSYQFEMGHILMDNIKNRKWISGYSYNPESNPRTKILIFNHDHPELDLKFKLIEAGKMVRKHFSDPFDNS